MIVGEYLQKVHCVPDNQIGVVAGPCHAEEVALERLSYLTIACTDEEKARFVADAMTRPFVNRIRCYAEEYLCFSSRYSSRIGLW